MDHVDAWPVRTAGLGPVAVGTTLWRWQGQLSVTAVVKMSLALVPDAPMSVMKPEPIRVADRHHQNNPLRSLSGVRETAPQLRVVDVVLYGNAHAPPNAEGQRHTTQSSVRLALRRDGETLIDKTLQVLGDRQPEGEPASFQQMPITLEHALGGIGWQDNPLGKGQGGSRDELPNLVDPDDPTGKLACFAPIPPAYGVRRKLSGGGSRKGLEALVADVPPELDWGYFQCAPVDQRIESLRGDEWLELDGLTREPLFLRTRLPGVGLRALARVYGFEQAGVPDQVPLRADLLQIDTERRFCTILWRGSFPLHDEKAAGDLVIVGALEQPPEVVAWPASVADIPDESFQRPVPPMVFDDPSDIAATREYVPGETPEAETLRSVLDGARSTKKR